MKKFNLKSESAGTPTPKGSDFFYLIMSKRKAFNFYFSYYDIAKELSDKDRLAFYDAIIQRQFYGIETELYGLAKFAYISQKHSIDSQVNGWESKMKEPLNQSITEGAAS